MRGRGGALLGETDAMGHELVEPVGGDPVGEDGEHHE